MVQVKPGLGRIVIVGNKQPHTGKLLGEDLFLVDEDGYKHRLPATSLAIHCDGRKEHVLATVVLYVAELDLDVLAAFVRDDVGID